MIGVSRTGCRVKDIFRRPWQMTGNARKRRMHLHPPLCFDMFSVQAALNQAALDQAALDQAALETSISRRSALASSMRFTRRLLSWLSRTVLVKVTQV